MTRRLRDSEKVFGKVRRPTPWRNGPMVPTPENVRRHKQMNGES